MPTLRSRLSAIVVIAFIGTAPAVSAEQQAATEFDHALVESARVVPDWVALGYAPQPKRGGKTMALKATK